MPNDEARKIFPQMLSYYMEQKGISQADIAVRLHVSKQIVSDWICGKKFPRVDNMQRLAEMFGVLLSDMYTDKMISSDGSSSVLPEVSSFSDLSKDEQTLVLAWRKADDTIKAGVCKLLDIPDVLKNTELSAM